MNARGEAYVAAGETAWAETWFKRTLEKDPRYLPAHNNLAVLYWNGGRADAATEHLGMALEIAPTDRTTVLNSGAVLVALGETADARNLYDRYLARFPDDAEIRSRRDGLTAACAGA